MNFSEQDQSWMTQALRLAAQGLNTTDPNPRVGCILVKDNRLVGQGWHQKCGHSHAEALALEDAGEQAKGAHAFVTLEPCSHYGKTGPCAQALIDAGVTAVTYTHDDPNPIVSGKGARLLQAAGIQVYKGLLAQQAEKLNCGFIKRQRQGKPWVRLKLATSLDGRLAAADGSSQWITNPAARDDVQCWRARSSAILTGGNTLRNDNPRLSVRLGNDSERQPLRVLLTTQDDYLASAKMFAADGAVLVISPKQLPAPADNVEHLMLPSEASQGIDLAMVLTALAEREVNELHIECGPNLAGKWMQSGLLDELLIYQADCILGEKGMPLFTIPEINTMEQVIRLPTPEIRQIGQDRRLRYLF